MWTWGEEMFIPETHRSTCKFNFLQTFLLYFWRKRKGSSLFINTIYYSVSCASVYLMLQWRGELVLVRLLGRIIWGCWWIGTQGIRSSWKCKDLTLRHSHTAVCLSKVYSSMFVFHSQRFCLFVCLFLRQGFSVALEAVLNSLHRPGWPRTHRELPLSSSQVLGLKACATTAQLSLHYSHFNLVS